MDPFKHLVYLLEQELNNQKKFLELLTAEQVAIVKVNQEQIEVLNEKKISLLDAARDLEEKRSATIKAIKPAAGDNKQMKLSEIAEFCATPQLKGELNRVGGELRETARTVQELNKFNADLVKHSLGLISSTLSILVSNAESDLPSYGKSGKLEAREEAPGRTRTFV